MKRPMFKQRYKQWSVVVLGLLAALHAQAQGGHVGGGKFAEGDFQHFMNRLSVYFADPRSYEVFPEVKTYDLAQGGPGSLSRLIQSIRPVIKDERVSYQGEPRDCIAGKDEASQLYFQCDLQLVPENTIENQPKLYTLILHEIFVHAGIERPLSKAIPSTYQVSSRIVGRLTKVTEYVPGYTSGMTNQQVIQEISDLLYRSIYSTCGLSDRQVARLSEQSKFKARIAMFLEFQTLDEFGNASYLDLRKLNRGELNKRLVSFLVKYSNQCQGDDTDDRFWGVVLSYFGEISTVLAR